MSRWFEGKAALLAASIATLQAPLVAVSWQLLMARCMRVKLNPFEPWVLALAVWLIYAVDHLLDTARPYAGRREPLRKQFCRRHWRAFCVAAIVGVAALALGAERLLWPATLWAGIRIALAAAVYLAFVQFAPPKWRQEWPREVAVATIFTAGVGCAVWAGDGQNIAPLWAPGIVLLLLALANCAVIETWEWEAGGRFAEHMPNPMARWIARYLPFFASSVAAGSLLLALQAAMPMAFAGAAFLAASALTLLAVCRRVIPVRYVNLAADLALCSPVLVLGFTAIMRR